MSIVPLDEFDTVSETRKVARGRGGFWRHPHSDAPYVSDPSGAVVKSGERKGQCVRLTYGSPSGFGDLIDDMTALEKFSARCVIKGLSSATIGELAAFTDADLDDPDAAQDAWRLYRAAAEWGGAKVGADRGSLFHALAHDDYCDTIDWSCYSDRATGLGLTTDHLRSALASWKLMLNTNGLEVLAMEVPCVNDAYRQAGTLDCIARLTRDLHFVDVNGEVITITAGTVLVLDIKTGKRRTKSNGVIEYWQSYAVQIAAYAGSVPYDNDSETRGSWEWDIDQRYGLIAHVDLLGAIRGEADATLVLVDLEAGRHAADLCMAAKEWGRRADVFSVAQRVDPPTIIDLARARQEADQARDPAPTVDPTFEGDYVEEGAFNRLHVRYDAVTDDARQWFGRIVSEAKAAGVPFNANGGTRTARRYGLYRGLLAIAESMCFGDGVDRILVALVYGATGGDDAVRFANVTPGHALGSLNADEAKAFALLAERLAKNDPEIFALVATNTPLPAA
jgi:hypothetical protein